jgi:hypothetical protein
VIDRLTVIVIGRPSGINDVKTPIANYTFYTAEYPIANPIINKNNPQNTAMHDIINVNLLISFLIGVSPESASSVRPAIYPIIVESPILNTIPLALPLVHKVPKNAIFLVSKIFSGSVH